VPKTFFEKTQELIDGGAVPLSDGPHTQRERQRERERKRQEALKRRREEKKRKLFGGNEVDEEERSGGGLFRQDVNEIEASGGKKSQNGFPTEATVGDLLSDPRAVSVGPIEIQETFPGEPLSPPADGEAALSHGNPFLATPPPSVMLSRGTPSWENGKELSSPSPQLFTPTTTPIIQLKNPLEILGQQPRQPKSQNVNAVINVNAPPQAVNPAVAVVQDFAVPNSPPGPSKEQKLLNQQVVVRENTIRTHQMFIKPQQPRDDKSFDGRNPFILPIADNSAAYVVNEQGSRTSRNPQEQYVSHAPQPPQNVDKSQFKPPATLMYGFKPLSTRPLPGPVTPAPSYATQGAFSAPSSLMFGFSPLSVTQSGPQRPAPTSGVTYSAPVATRVTQGPQLPSAAYEKRVPKRQVAEKARKKKTPPRNKKKESRGMMDFIADMLRPITSLVTAG